MLTKSSKSVLKCVPLENELYIGVVKCNKLFIEEVVSFMTSRFTFYQVYPLDYLQYLLILRMWGVKIETFGPIDKEVP